MVAPSFGRRKERRAHGQKSWAGAGGGTNDISNEFRLCTGRLRSTRSLNSSLPSSFLFCFIQSQI